MYTVSEFLQDTVSFRDAVVQYPIPETPQCLNQTRYDWFLGTRSEEQDEFRIAHERGDVQGCVDAILDEVYFMLGRVAEMGVRPDHPWIDIHNANMRKKRGELAKRPGSLGHDAVKPPGWVGPDHSWMDEITLSDIENLRRRVTRRKLQTEQAKEQRLSGTGGQALKFSGGKVPVTLVPWEGIEVEAQAFDYGRGKYSAWNHLAGRPFSEYADAAIRHIHEGFMSGEDLDPDSGVHHIGHARACLSMLMCAIKFHPELDDRRPSPVSIGAK